MPLRANLLSAHKTKCLGTLPHNTLFRLCTTALASHVFSYGLLTFRGRLLCMLPLPLEHPCPEAMCFIQSLVLLASTSASRARNPTRQHTMPSCAISPGFSCQALVNLHVLCSKGLSQGSSHNQNKSNSNNNSSSSNNNNNIKKPASKSTRSIQSESIVHSTEGWCWGCCWLWLPPQSLLLEQTCSSCHRPAPRIAGCTRLQKVAL